MDARDRQPAGARGTAPADPRITYPLSFIIFFSVLNGTMFNVAIPDIAADFRLLPSQVSWVMTGYIVVFALGSLVFGKLADLFSVKNLITAGLILLNLGSLLGLITLNYPMLIAARVLQATGGSAIPALGMMVATRYVPAEVKGRVLGIIASTVAVAAGIGPVAGGFISGTWHWRYLFVFTLMTLVAIPFLRTLLPAEERKEGNFDGVGAALAAAGIVCILLFATRGQWWFLPAGAGGLLLFGLHVRRAPAPFIAPELFSNRTFRSTVVATFLVVGTMFGTMFMAPIMLRDLNLLSSAGIGLVMFPGAMSAAVMGSVGGRLTDSKGSGPVLAAGMGTLLVGHLLLSTLAGRAPFIIAAALVVNYVGFSLLQSSLPHRVSESLPDRYTGVGMGIYTLFFFVSGAFTAAFIGRLLDLPSTGLHLNPFNPNPGRSPIYANIFVLLAAMVFIGWSIHGGGVGKTGAAGPGRKNPEG